VGIEAVSRGAEHAYFIEKEKEAFAVLVENCRSVDSRAFTCKRGDTFALLPELVAILPSPAFFYFDPPFSFREGMESVYKTCFSLAASLPRTKVSMLIFEHMNTLSMPEQIGGFSRTKTKAFGKSALSYYM
jgi:16S rRNA G966 N2-methylase RsmD